MRTVVVCLALVAGWAFAQDAPAQNAPEKAVRDIRDVQLGMSRDHVLAGLGDKYNLTRIDDPKSQLAKDGDEYWGIDPKHDPESQLEREAGAIRFWQGRAASVKIGLYSSRTGESTRFAEHLFWLIYKRADPPAPPNRLCGVDLRIGMPKDEVISELGKNCKVQPMGTSSTTWCVFADYPCSHTISFEDETLSSVKLDRFYTESNARWVTLPVQLQDRHDDKGEELKLFFTLDGQDFSVTVWKRPGQPDSVNVEQTVCCGASNEK
jgi:hypothetical protein